MVLTPRQSGPAQQRQPAGNIQFIGQSGQPALQFQGINPVNFNVGENLPDQTQPLFARQQQAVDEAYAASQTVIQTSARTAQARAEASAQSGFAGAIAGIGQAITAGLELRQQAQEQQQAELAGLLEREIRNRTIDLFSVVTQEGQDQGEFQAYRTFINELTQYQGRLSSDQLSALQNIGFDALEQVSRNRATNKRELLSQARAETVQTALTEIELQASTDGVAVAMGRMDPQTYLDNLNRAVNERAASGNYSAFELTRMWNQVMAGAATNLSDATRELLDIDSKMSVGREILQSLAAIENDRSLTPQQRSLEIAQLQVRANQADLGLSLQNILPSETELLEQAAARRQFETRFQNETVELLLSTDPEYARQAANAALGQAVSLLRSANSGQIEAYRRSDNPLLQQVALEADALQQEHDDFTARTRRTDQIQAELSQIDIVLTRAQRRANPTETLGPLQVTDPVLLQLLQVAGSERGTISEEEYAAIVSNAARVKLQLERESNDLASEQADAFSVWSQRGINIMQLQPLNNEAWTEVLQGAQTYMDSAHARESQRLIDSNNFNPESFNQGTGITPPASVPLYNNAEGHTFPLAAELGAPVVTSEYGMRTHPTLGGQRMHWGIDIALPVGTNVRSIQGGRVVRVAGGCRAGDHSCGGGFGNFVIVQTPSGHFEQFNHLERLNVSEGQTINPGDAVATSGNTGRGSGPHLDFMVYKPGTQLNQLAAGSQSYRTQTINPREYFGTVTNLEPVPYGGGLPVAQTAAPNEGYSSIARNFTLQEMFRYSPASGGVIETAPGVFERPEQVYNNSNPRRRQGWPVWRSGYGDNNNNIEHNYGYEALRSNRPFREALVATANRLDIPAQWLADVIELETTNFSPARHNSQGAVGLIQFHPSGGLADVAQWMGVNMATAKRRLTNMSHAEQMQWVERYLYTYGPGDGHKFEHIADLYGLINQGPSYWQRGRQRSMSVRDGRNSLQQLLQRLGRNVGRRYNFDDRQASSRRLHTHSTGYCAECSRQMNNFGRVLPHYQEIA